MSDYSDVFATASVSSVEDWREWLSDVLSKLPPIYSDEYKEAYFDFAISIQEYRDAAAERIGRTISVMPDTVITYSHEHEIQTDPLFALTRGAKLATEWRHKSELLVSVVVENTLKAIEENVAMAKAARKRYLNPQYIVDAGKRLLKLNAEELDNVIHIGGGGFGSPEPEYLKPYYDRFRGVLHTGDASLSLSLSLCKTCGLPKE